MNGPKQVREMEDNSVSGRLQGSFLIVGGGST